MMKSRLALSCTLFFLSLCFLYGETLILSDEMPVFYKEAGKIKPAFTLPAGYAIDIQEEEQAGYKIIYLSGSTDNALNLMITSSDSNKAKASAAAVTALGTGLKGGLRMPPKPEPYVPPKPKDPRFLEGLFDVSALDYKDFLEANKGKPALAIPRRAEAVYIQDEDLLMLKLAIKNQDLAAMSEIIGKY